MTSIATAHDTQPYRRLLGILGHIKRSLRSLGRPRAAEIVRDAMQFYGGSPAEFLGESRLALRNILEVEQGLPADMRFQIKEIVEQIDAGFREMGGG